MVASRSLTGNIDGRRIELREHLLEHLETLRIHGERPGEEDVLIFIDSAGGERVFGDVDAYENRHVKTSFLSIRAGACLSQSSIFTRALKPNQLIMAKAGMEQTHSRGVTPSESGFSCLAF